MKVSKDTKVMLISIGVDKLIKLAFGWAVKKWRRLRRNDSIEGSPAEYTGHTGESGGNEPS